MVKHLPANAGDIRDVSLISGSGRSLGVGNGNPLQYSCLEKLMYRGAWQFPVHEVAELDMTEHSVSIAFLLEHLSRAQVGESWCQMS